MSVEKAKTAEPEYWRSIDEWMDGERFRTMMKDEFPEEAAEWLDPVSRRQFVQLMGASIALAGAGCNPSLKPAPQKKVLPYVKQPDQIIPGVPRFYATAMAQAGGVGIGMLVKSQEGRPIKCEGNPQHIDSQGGLELQALAAPLTMYDPDRSKGVQMGSESTTFDKAITAIKGELAKRADKQGEGVRILTEPTTSPTLIALMDKLKERYPKSKWIQYEPINRDNITKATQAAFNANVTTVYDYDHADVILSLDADFLSGPGSVGHARDFASRRKVDLIDAEHDLDHDAERKAKKEGKKAPHIHWTHEQKMAKVASGLSRLYVVEGMLTSTGAVADHRLPLKPSMIEGFARALAFEMKIPGVAAVTNLPEAAKAWVAPLAKDLLSKKQKALVVAGPQLSPATHLLVLAINKHLESPGHTLKYVTPATASSTSDIKTLVDEMQAGKVELLIMSGVNPVYDAPVDLEFAKALDAVKANKGVVVHHGLYTDETAMPHANWHINASHFLECWGDVRGNDGTAIIQQTTLNEPLYGGKSLLELMARLIDSPIVEGKELVKATWEKQFKDKKISGEFDIYWQTALRDGMIPQTQYPVAAVSNVNLEKLNDKALSQVAINEIEVQFLPSPVLHDGRQANNGWLQELPQPITNLTWDNAAMMSPQTAQDLHITQSFAWTGGERGSTETEMVKVIVNKRELSIPAHIVPGMADKLVVLHLGYGRDRPGSKGKPNADLGGGGGFDAYKLRSSDAMWTVLTTDVLRQNSQYILAVAGAHSAMESRRPVRHATVAEFSKDEKFAQIPGASAGEFEEIRALTPGTIENFALLYGERKEGDKNYPNPYAHDHAHDHEHSAKHDARLKKLSLYLYNPIEVKKPDGTKDNAEKAYRRWGMTIDLGSCIGCSACTLACVAENNIPVVGKKQVTMGRAMHWIRIDRYFSIPGKKPMEDELGGEKVKLAERKEKVKQSAAIRTHFQPVPCQQCEKAQCEVVCPVGATVHSADGLNDMAYNRCVGTRYCGNNCAYKVRRFNFLQYSDYTTESLKLLNNPEVTVRTRGVMEKCTYCVQRIRTAEIEAEREWEKKLPDGKPARERDAHGRPKIMDGEVLTACQQACPTGAITFGDINDPKSDVLKTKAQPHNYGLLAELNTMPRTSYLAAIRNPNPDMPQGA